MKGKYLITCIGLMSLAGCNGTPKCGDKDVVTLVADIATTKSGWGDSLTVDAIRPVSINKDIKSCECEATINNTKSVYYGARTHQVSYTAQRTTDGDLYVELRDVSRR